MVESNDNQVESKSIAQSVDNIQDAVSKLKIHDSQEQGNMARLPPFPYRPGEPDCAYYLRTGSCGYGTNCRYNHPPLTSQVAQVTQHTEELPERVGQPDCGYYLRTGTCKYGSTCKYNHPRDRNGAGPVSFNALGLPIRQDEKPCPHYMRTGNCKFSVACKFHHPEPLTYGAGSAQSGPGSTMPSVVPSTGLTYISGIPSFPRTPYMSNPYLQGLQTYMPVVFSPSQGLNPPQGWNTYMGSNLLYNTRNQGESGYDGQSHLSNYSEPTNLQKMNNETGTKKYGSDGKYRHMKERIAQPVAEIGPHGLPLRPGLAVCSYYNSYGLCKFGPGCRFDHPFNGYAYNCGLTISHLPMLDASSLNYKQPKSDTNAKMSADPPEQPGSSHPKSSQPSS